MTNEKQQVHKEPVTAGEVAPEISSKYLPPVTYRDLPEPASLRRIIGPGVVLAAGGIGSGEFVLWPYVSQQTGLGFLWAAVLGCLLMFYIATECCRYTMATGETIITGFTRLWKPWWIGFIILALLPNLWPGYATGTATLVTFATGGGPVIPLTLLFLLAIVLSLTLSPVVYRMMENVMTARMAITLIFLLVAVVVSAVIKEGAWVDFVVGFGEVGQIPQEIPFSVLAGAVAFAGAGGTGVLMASNYCRDKNLAMGAHIPRIVSPITGSEEAGSNVGHFFPATEENMRRWRRWWKAENLDQFITFFGFTIAAICVMSVLAYATAFGEDVGEGFDFLKAVGGQLGSLIGQWFTIFFYLAGALALFATNLAVWDQISRITADAIKANWLRENRFWTESRIYFATLVALFAFSAIVLASGLQQPLILITITAVLSGVTSFVYCALIVQLNRFMLPKQVRMGGVRFAVMSFAVVFYGFFFVITVLNLLGVVA